MIVPRTQRRPKAEMDCPICVEICVEPMIGTCGHTICMLCLQQIKTECPVCRKSTRFSKNYALRDLLKETKPKAYAARERECLITRSPQALIEEMKKTWPDALLTATDYDDKHTMYILQAVIKHCRGDEEFTKIAIPGGSAFVIPDTKDAKYRVTGDGQHWTACRCNGFKFLFIARKKKFL